MYKLPTNETLKLNNEYYKFFLKIGCCILNLVTNLKIVFTYKVKSCYKSLVKLKILNAIMKVNPWQPISDLYLIVHNPSLYDKKLYLINKKTKTVDSTDFLLFITNHKL